MERHVIKGGAMQIFRVGLGVTVQLPLRERVRIT